MLLTKNKKKQIEGIDFNKSYPVIEAVKLLKEKSLLNLMSLSKYQLIQVLTPNNLTKM